MLKNILKKYLYVVALFLVSTNAAAVPYDICPKISPVLDASYYIGSYNLPDGVLPMFRAYPKLANNIPHIRLIDIDSTPITYINEIDGRDVKLYVKNEGVELTNKNGERIFTGNKRRKLEFIFADILDKNATHIYTAGAAGSNFATATATYANHLGVNYTLVLGPQRNTRYTQRNLKLDFYNNANFIVCETRQERNKKIEELADNKKINEYVIPVGGSNEIGVIGFINAVFEVVQQIESGVMPVPDIIYLPVGSEGTAAGIIAGCIATGLRPSVKLVCIGGCNPNRTFEGIARLINESVEYLSSYDSNFPMFTTTPDELSSFVEIISDEEITGVKYLLDDYENNNRHRDLELGAYARATPKTAEAVKALLDASGIKLDGTYSAKAFAGYLRDLRSGKLDGKNVLFWDTFCAGSFSEITETVNTNELPLELQKYINEEEGYSIQTYDLGV